MSRTVYAIASGKGGVGKTTTAVNLGAALAADGHAVVVVDTDLGMANLAGFLDFDSGDGATLHEVLAGEADVDDAIYAAPGDIDVVPSNTDIEAFARAETARLGTVVEALGEAYDYVLLDTGAGISHDTVLPLGLADEVILVSTPDVASVSDTAKTGDLTRRVGGTVVGAVLNKRSSNILDAKDVEETLGTDVLAVVPADDAVPTSIDAGRPAVDFAPTSPAALVYDGLAAVLTADGAAADRAEAGPAGAEADPDPAEGATGEVDEAAAVPFGAEFEKELRAADGEGWDELAAEAGVDVEEAGADDLLGLDPDAEREFLDAIGGDDGEPISPEPTANAAPSEAPEPDATDTTDGEPATDALAADVGIVGDSPEPVDEGAENGADAENREDAGNGASLDEPATDPDSGTDVTAYIEPAEGAASADADGAQVEKSDARDSETDEDAEPATVLDGDDAEDGERAEDAEGGFFGKLTGMFSR